MAECSMTEEHKAARLLKNSTAEELGLDLTQFKNLQFDLFVLKMPADTVLAKIKKYRRMNKKTKKKKIQDEEIAREGFSVNPLSPLKENRNRRVEVTYDESEDDCKPAKKPESALYGTKRTKGKKRSIQILEGEPAPEQVRHYMPGRMMREVDDTADEVFPMVAKRQPISFRTRADMPKKLREEIYPKYQPPRASKKKSMPLPEEDSFEYGPEDVCVTPPHKRQIPIPDRGKTGRPRTRVGEAEEAADKYYLQKYLNPIRIEAITPNQAIDGSPSGSIFQIYREFDEEEETC